MRGVVASLLFALVYASESVLAISQGDLHAVQYDTVFYDPANGNDDCSGGQLPTTVPDWGRQIFSDAANQYNVSPAIVASIYWAEHNGIFLEPPPPYGKGNSYQSSGTPATQVWPDGVIGARGPFQFEYTTWLGYLNANPNHHIDPKNNQQVILSVEDLKDAAYGAAKKLFDLGGKNGAPLGSISNTLQPGTIVNAIRSYNTGGASSDPAIGYVTTALKAYMQLTQADPSTPCSNGTSGQAIALTNSPCVAIKGTYRIGNFPPGACPWVPAKGFPAVKNYMTPPYGTGNENDWGQCTWWTQYNFSLHVSGNGGDWYSNAKKAGLPTSRNTPSIGDAVSFNTSDTGHVAFVIAVSQDMRSFTVTEANFNFEATNSGNTVAAIQSTRTISVTNPTINGFIGPDPAAVAWVQAQSQSPSNPTKTGGLQ